jgi:hypothetical protein
MVPRRIGLVNIDLHAMYCSAFVRYCYKEAGREFLGSEISVSNTTPEDIAQTGVKSGTVKVNRP